MPRLSLDEIWKLPPGRLLPWSMLQVAFCAAAKGRRSRKSMKATGCKNRDMLIWSTQHFRALRASLCQQKSVYRSVKTHLVVKHYLLTLGSSGQGSLTDRPSWVRHPCKNIRPPSPFFCPNLRGTLSQIVLFDCYDGADSKSFRIESIVSAPFQEVYWLMHRCWCRRHTDC